MAPTQHPRPCLPIRSASVLMPTWQGMEFLDRVIDSLAAQETSLRWDLHVIDSGSTDGTLERLRQRAEDFSVPFSVYAIASAEFDHGDTRNQLAVRSRGDLLVYLSQDAIPSSSNWLETLARNFEDPRVGAATCRNVPRKDAQFLTGVLSHSDPGYGSERIERTMPEPAVFAALTSDEIRVLYNFNDVASAIRRELWELHPFPRTMMGEDVLMARGLIHAGYTLVHDSEATVDHSHDYGLKKMQWRGFVDGKFSAEWLDRINVGAEDDIAALAERLVERDTERLTELGVQGDELKALQNEALALRTALARGLYEGGRSPLRYPASAMREDRMLRILMIDAEEKRSAIGRELGRRGHDVHFLTVLASTEPMSLQPWQREAGQYWTSWKAMPGTNLESALVGWLAATPIDLCHLGSSELMISSVIRMLSDMGCATVCDWHDDNEPKMRARMLCDLRLTANVAQRKQALSDWADGDAVLDPQLFALVREPDGENGESFTAAVADAEFRYRALSAICRESSSAEVDRFEFVGSELDVRGESTPQGPDWLLLMPGSVGELSVPIRRGGHYDVTIEQFQLGVEKDVLLAGDVELDGQLSCKIEGQGASAEDRALEIKFSVEFTAKTHRLRLKPADGAVLRICRVRIESSERSSDSHQPLPAALPRLVEELRVEPGPPVETSTLPHVAIVIPHLQDTAQLAEALRSIGELNYPAERIEILIVDNSGALQSRVEFEAIQREGIRVLEQSKNLGFAAACNVGAAAAAGAELLVFVNDDMVFDREFLRELVSPIVRGECACSTARLFDAQGELLDTSGTGTTFLGICVQPGFGEPTQDWQEVPRKTLFGCGGSMAIRADVFHEARGFDENYFAYYEDLDLGWRLWLLGHEVHYVPTAIGRHHHSSTSKKLPPEQVRLIMVRNSLYTVIKNYDDENLQRILPAIFGLAARRAFLKADLDTSSFRIGESSATTGQTKPSKAEIDRIGAADLIAIDDLLSNWDDWMERRREVQSRRVRTDAEIQRMFLQPLACVEGDSAYAALQASLAQMFGLDRVFARR